MHVETAERWQLQHLPTQQQAIGGDDDYIGTRRAQAGKDLRRSKAGRLEERQSEPTGVLGNGRSDRLATAADGSIRLTHDESDLMSGLDQTLERRGGELWRAHEDDAHS